MKRNRFLFIVGLLTITMLLAVACEVQQAAAPQVV
jgi:hypothetical protein